MAKTLLVLAILLGSSNGATAQIPQPSILSNPLIRTNDLRTEYFGLFEGEVVTRWNPDGRSMTLEQPFAYVDPSGFRWEAPKGALIDGASIPKFLWSIIGGPFEGLYRSASVIHDVACDERKQHWAKVHRAFYTALRAGKVSAFEAKMMFAAVYHRGPRWSIFETRQECDVVGGKQVCRNVQVEVPPPPPILTEEQVLVLSDEIRRREQPFNPTKMVDPSEPMSLEEIESYVVGQK